MTQPPPSDSHDAHRAVVEGYKANAESCVRGRRDSVPYETAVAIGR